MDTKISVCTLPDLQQSQISVHIPKANNFFIMPTSLLNFPLEAGQKFNLQPVSWEQFTDTLAKSNKNRSSRFAYANMVLEIMAPLEKNEKLKVLITELIKVLLKSQNKPWEAFESITFKYDNLQVALEPEVCFYIQKYQHIIGKNKVNLTKKSAPNLALETDNISTTKLAAYAALQVSELWIYSNGKLRINVLMNGEYTNFQTSPTFGGVVVSRLIPQYIERSKIVGIEKTLAEFELSIKNDRSSLSK
ncbi:MAG: Uma2 family endonuclease [Mastigocoleus sp.]